MKKILATSLLLLAASGGTALAASAQPLVDANWVKENSCKPGVVVLDIRSAIDGGSQVDYLRGHIPCAIYSDFMKGGWRTKVNNVPAMLPPLPQIAKLIGSLGIDNNTHVVIYSAGTNATSMGASTRVFWTFKVLGDNNVSILNGGYAGYVADKSNKIQTGMNTPKPATFSAHFRPELDATEAEVAKAMKQHVALVDNRPSDQYLGVNHVPLAKRSGTIPGAKNVPEAWLTENDGGKFRDAAALKKLYKDAGVATKGEQINFCNTGHWASVGWFASREILGNKQARLYDGSMVEWSADPKAPMVQKIKTE
ncbi:thiosulfate sulfurtransferase [mine drainage metagenome]|uniref:Thiosulfate sulfurtransferase n=1 Tax=mine drainage metagenome TaxID=410659 RepID=A0A1J5RXL3_9ZZZZ